MAAAEWKPEFDWITDRLAVGGCFPRDREIELARTHEVRAVVDLRSEDCDDGALLTKAGIRFLHLPTPDLQPVSVAMLDEGVAFVRAHLNRGQRVLIHCQHGIGRSALLALCVLVDGGMEPMAALTLAKDARERISPSPSQFEGWCRWLRAHGHSAPSMHEFGCVAYRHLANS
jgi:protein-tyrosine phosphatase